MLATLQNNTQLKVLNYFLSFKEKVLERPLLQKKKIQKAEKQKIQFTTVEKLNKHEFEAIM